MSNGAKNYMRSDGNGGLDINVQKAMLKKYGPIWAALFLALSGLGAKFGEKAWAAVWGYESQTLLIERNTENINNLYDNVDGLRREFREDLREIKAGQDRIEDMILGIKGDQNG